MTDTVLLMLIAAVLLGTFFACQLAILLYREIRTVYRRWRIQRDVKKDECLLGSEVPSYAWRQSPRRGN